MNKLRFSHGLELSYLAGYFEGEGTITLVNQVCKTANSGRTLVLVIQVGNTEEYILQIYQKRFGGNYDIHRRDRINPKWKKVFRWRLHAKKALSFLRIIYPYLKTPKRRELAELGISFAEHKRNGGGTFSPEYYSFEKRILERVRELNKKG